AALPHTVAILFGRYLLKMNPIIVLGACSGAGTITAALRAIQEEAQSELPALGYTVPYAIGNIERTSGGPALTAMTPSPRLVPAPRELVRSHCESPESSQ